jgi:nucleoside diphosphate kinase
MASQPAPHNVCVVVKTRTAKHWPKIVMALHKVGIFTQEANNVDVVSPEAMKEFYAAHVGKWYFPRLLSSVSGPCVFIWAETADIAVARAAIGPTDPAQAREEAPDSIRALFGTELPHNAVHLSDSVEEAARELAVCRKWKFLSSVGLEDEEEEQASAVVIPEHGTEHDT